MASLVELKFKVDAKDVDKAKKSMKGLEKQSKGTEKGMKKWAGAMKKAAVAVAIAAVIYKTVDALAALGKAAILTADAIGKTSTKLGLSAESLQDMRIVADAASVGIAALEVGYQRFARRLDTARKGVGPLADVMRDLNVELKNQDGTLRLTEDVFKDYGQALSKVQDPTEKLAKAFAFLDTEGVGLINMFEMSNKQQQEAIRNAKQYGDTLSNHVIRVMERYATELGAVEKGTERLKAQQGIVLAPLTLWWAKLKNNAVGFVNALTGVTAEMERMKRFTADPDMFKEEALGLSLSKDNQADLTAHKQALLDVENIVDRITKSYQRRNRALAMRVGFDEKGLQRELDGSKELAEAQERIQVAGKAVLENELARQKQKADANAKEIADAIEKEAKLKSERQLKMDIWQIERDRKKRLQAVNDLAQEGFDLLEETVRLEEERKQLNKDNLEKWRQLADPLRVHKQDLKEIEALMAKFPEHGQALAEAYRQIAEEMKDMVSPEEGEKGPLSALLDDWKDLKTQAQLFQVEGIERVSAGLAELATTGKLNFREFAIDMLKWIAKMIIRMAILRAIMSAMGAADTVTQGTLAPGEMGPPAPRDHGGRGRAGGVYSIGTGAQPELFVPDSAGSFYPGGGKGSGVTINSLSVVVRERKDETSEQQAQRIGRAIKEQIRPLIYQELVDQHRPGNMFNPNMLAA